MDWYKVINGLNEIQKYKKYAWIYDVYPIFYIVI